MHDWTHREIPPPLPYHLRLPLRLRVDLSGARDSIAISSIPSQVRCRARGRSTFAPGLESCFVAEYLATKPTDDKPSRPRTKGTLLTPLPLHVAARDPRAFIRGTLRGDSGVVAATPLVLPGESRWGLVRAINRILLTLEIRRRLRGMNITSFITWTYFPAWIYLARCPGLAKARSASFMTSRTITNNSPGAARGCGRGARIIAKSRSGFYRNAFALEKEECFFTKTSTSFHAAWNLSISSKNHWGHAPIPPTARFSDTTATSIRARSTSISSTSSPQSTPSG